MAADRSRLSAHRVTEPGSADADVAVRGGAPIRVVIADDQALVRAGFRMILEAQPDIRVVGEATEGRSAADTVQRVRPDVVLMDVRMPGVDGLDATRQILAAEDAVARVLVLTTFDLDEYVYAALRSGASGFLLKDVSPEHLVMAVRLIAAGEQLLAPSITRRLVERFAQATPAREHVAQLETLTAREQEVLRLVARGLSNDEIAERLVVSEATVKTHVGHVFAKLDLRDRAQAVVVAYETGLVRAGEA
jgi:DNA-binding NarL/FixJ family response regulator